MATEARVPPPFNPAARIFHEVDSRQFGTPVRGLVYATVDAGRLEADLYLPEESHKPAPIVFMVHGAVPEGLPIAPKDWGQYRSWGEAIAASGMAALAFNHRMRWNNGFVAGSIASAEQDLSAAIEFVRANAATYAIDPQRMAVMAFSAGGPLLARLIRERPDWLRCIVAFYAVLGDPHPGTPDAGRFSALDALSGGKLPPIFIAKAGYDMPFINASIDEFVKRLASAGADHEFIEHPSGFHGFDVNTDDDTSRRIIQVALGFMKSRVGS